MRDEKESVTVFIERRDMYGGNRTENLESCSVIARRIRQLESEDIAWQEVLELRCHGLVASKIGVLQRAFCGDPFCRVID
jgi:hypothetical protein